MADLTAKNLKDALWITLEKVQSGVMDAGQGDSVATQAREILRTVNTQLRVSHQSKQPVPADVISFSES